jgi:iron(III) transport system ATP-binding protein
MAFGLPDDRRESGRKRVADLLERLGLTGLAGRRPHQLSGGEAQRVAIARALAPASPLLLLDEPFSDLDAALVERVVAVVREEVERSGATVLLAAHDLTAAAKLCSQVAILRAGSLRYGPGPWTEAGLHPGEPFG